MNPPDLDTITAAFDGGTATVGIEEELMLLDPGTLDLAPVSAEVLGRLDGDARFKGELPAAQIELISAPAETVGRAATQLRAARQELARAAEGRARLAGAGTHGFAAEEGELSTDPRYGFTRREYGPVARRQLVFGLHVHVAVAGAERALGVHNALRSFLPSLAALAANAPWYGDRPSGFASVRPKISELLPRQGVPPVLRSLEQLAAAYRFGRASGAFEPASWWWELRLHPRWGTVELRVPDQQTTVAESAAVAAVAQCLVVSLGRRLDAGEELAVHPGWAIAENRWLAARHGLAGDLLDLDSGERRPARAVVAQLIESLAPLAEELGCSHELAEAARLARRNGAERQLAAGDPRAATAELAERFLD